MKKLLLLSLLLFGAYAMQAQTKDVHLYGSLKEFDKTEVDMNVHGPIADFSDAGSIKIPVKSDGSFDLVVP